MGIRQAINQHSVPVAAVTGCVLVLLLLLLVFPKHRTPGTPPPPTLSYFSSDDGKTFFADDNTLVAPFQRDGHEVDAACVFSCTGNRFVGYLERAVNPDAKKFVENARRQLLTQASAHPMQGPDGDVVNQIMQRLEVKRPGDTHWVKELSPQARSILYVTCPDGGAPTQVGP